MDIPARHGRLHCTLQGEGDPLLLLHGGLGIGLAHFREQMDDFASAYRLIIPDLLGYGRSGRRASFDDFYDRDAEDVVALMQHLKLPPVHLLGFSDGAIVAMIVAADHGDLVRSLVLVGGQAILDEHAMQETRRLAPPEQLPTRLQQALASRHGEHYWRELVTSYVDAAERLYARGGDIARYRLAAIQCPTLIVQGEDDPWVSPRDARMLRSAIGDSRIELFPGAGHEVHREQPEAFNRLVLEFLSSVP